MNFKVLIGLVLMSFSIQAKTIKVAVIDTGFDMKSKWPMLSGDRSNLSENKLNLYPPKLCKEGHFNFILNNSDVTDNHGHGTHIAGLIAKYNQDVDYCLVILKYYDPKSPGYDNLDNVKRAIASAIEMNVDIINYSGGGVDRNEEECELAKKFINKGGTFVAAAGNEKSNLKSGRYYPAMCDERIKLAVNLNKDFEILASSNYVDDDSSEIVEFSNTLPLVLSPDEQYRRVVSHIKTIKGFQYNKNVYRIVGEARFSLLPGERYGSMTGTSQSAAILTSALLRGTCSPDIYNPFNLDFCNRGY